MTKLSFLLMALFAAVIPQRAGAAAADQDFYRGKTIRFVVGFAAGGGFDDTRAPSPAICPILPATRPSSLKTWAAPAAGLPPIFSSKPARRTA